MSGINYEPKRFNLPGQFQDGKTANPFKAGVVKPIRKSGKNP
jgi:hypothetical protein